MNAPVKNKQTAVSAVQQSQDGQHLKLADDIEARTNQFAGALPRHIPVERFKRVLIVAVSATPALMHADRRTFFNSAMKAASDGLLPDGREGALVIYRTRIKEGNSERWIDAVQWMPMIAGIRKKVRNSEEIATWDAHVVFEKDEFDYQLGLNPNLHHKPLLSGDRGKPIAAYSVAKLKSGEITFEVMSESEIWDVWRRASKNQKDGKPTGPWKDWTSEMFRKTVARRHSKVLPMSTDLDDLMRRDDELYDFNRKDGEDENAKDVTPKRPQLHDFTERDHVEIVGSGEAEQQEAETKSEAKAEPAGENQPANEFGAYEAREQGIKDFAPGKDYAIPANIKQLGLDDAYANGWSEAAEQHELSVQAYAAGRAAREKGVSLHSAPNEVKESGTIEDWKQGWNKRDLELSKTSKA